MCNKSFVSCCEVPWYGMGRNKCSSPFRINRETWQAVKYHGVKVHVSVTL